jgi:cold shock CspA family protein
MIRTGKVKFWHDEKGYAFIIDEETKKEFYTYKKVLHPDEKRLFNDNKVEYELKEKCGKSANEIHAINVKTIR